MANNPSLTELRRAVQNAKVQQAEVNHARLRGRASAQDMAVAEQILKDAEAAYECERTRP
jgi:hypothetical protein